LPAFQDSFAHTIPAFVRQHCQRKYQDLITCVTLNAGCSSYSPAIYIPQAKILIPLLKPDFVVVGIDQTDMGDDSLRYKNLIVRDGEGKNIAVRRSPCLHAFLSGLCRIKEQPLYLVRFVMKIYHTRFYVPVYMSSYYGADSRHSLDIPRDKNANPEKYVEEIRFFEDNLKELTDTLINLMGDKNRILFITHPHLQHLRADSRGFYWNNFVSGALAKVCQNQGVPYYDITQDFKDKIEQDPQKYYIPENMHFNRLGIEVYGELVAAKMLPILEPFIKEKASGTN